MDQTTICNILDLFPEILIHIFLHLPVKNVLIIRQVSKALYKISKNITIWNCNFNSMFGIKTFDSQDETQFKYYYLNSYKLELHDKIRYGITNRCTTMVKNLLTENKKTPNPTLGVRSSLIYLAALKGLDEIVDTLILTGWCHANEINNNDAPPLFVASQENHLNTVKILIKHGADVNAKFGDLAIFSIACSKGNIDIVNYLISLNIDINAKGNSGVTPLYIACQNGKDDVVKTLLHHNAITNSIFRIGFTPLYVSCCNGHLNIVNMLIVHGVDINTTTDNSSCPLYVATQNGHYKIVETLIDNKVNVNKSYFKGYPPLYIATQNGFQNIVEKLCPLSNVNEIMPNKITSLYIACQHGYVDIVTTLLNHGADVHIFTGNFCALDTAIIKGHYEIVKILLTSVSFELDMITHDVLVLACKNNHLNITKLLLSFGIKPIINTIGNNLLHMAVSNNCNEQIINLLLDMFPHYLFEKNNNCETPFNLAFMNKEFKYLHIIETFCKTHMIYK